MSNEVSPQDTPAICEYSGLRPVEGYTEEKEDWVVDLWSEKICKEVDRLVLEELIEAVKNGKIK